MAETTTNLQVYCNTLYDLFDKEAVNVESEGSVFRIFKGFIVQSASNAGIPDGVYTRVMERLTLLDCLQVLEVGRRNAPSIIVLNRPPTQEVWDEVGEKDLTKGPRTAKMMEQEMKNLRDQIGEVNAIEAFRAIDIELTSIKQRLDTIEAQLNG